MTEKTIYLIGGDDDEQATITAEPRDGLCHIKFTYRNKVVGASGSDYFEAFCKIRRKLEPEKIIPFCYGASLNVFPSGMCREMEAGMKAYRLKQGEKTSMSDLVNIFDAGHDVIPAFTGPQKEFFDTWLQSITTPNTPPIKSETLWRRLLSRIRG